MKLNGRLIHNWFVAAVLLFLAACGGDKKPTSTQRPSKPSKPVHHKPTVSLKRPDFNPDSAYAFVEKQVLFGPRVPNTEAHQKTAKYLTNKLKSYGFEVEVQRANVKSFNNKTLHIQNIIGQFNPDAKKRVVLMSHWDSRPFADQDNNNQTKPIDAANDGASGVGILLEVARQLSMAKPQLGVDIIFFDAEDYGQPAGSMQMHQADTWCLGSQYWSKNLHKPGYTADFGILLDMAGAQNALFTKESISMQYAPDIMNKVWRNAQALNHQDHFINDLTYFVGTDDHYYVNHQAGIPTIDIIQYDPNTGAFAPHWHTHQDNMQIISKATLAAVGETVLATVLQYDKEVKVNE